jgi:hypothetical protein
MEEEGSDVLHGTPIEHWRSGCIAPCDVDNTNDHCSPWGRPLHALSSSVDRSSILANPAETAGTSVALGDGVGCDETECPFLPEKPKCAPEKVRDEVRSAVALFVDDLKPIGVRLAVVFWFSVKMTAGL